jgi:hypothetical protein
MVDVAGGWVFCCVGVSGDWATEAAAQQVGSAMMKKLSVHWRKFILALFVLVEFQQEVGGSRLPCSS